MEDPFSYQCRKGKDWEKSNLESQGGQVIAGSIRGITEKKLLTIKSIFFVICCKCQSKYPFNAIDAIIIIF